jgi:hypothetical protein
MIMDYMFLLYSDESKVAQLTPDQMAGIMSIHGKIQEDAKSRGIFKGAQPLARTSTAVTVTSVNGQTISTDGPYAETKEVLGGYYILDCKDIEEAKEWAARINQTVCGTFVEIRALVEVPTLEHCVSREMVA